MQKINRERKYLLAFVLAASATMVQCNDAKAGNWTKADTGRELAFQIAHFADATTTADIHNHNDIVEAGPAKWFIGNNPGRQDTAVYFAASGAAHAAVSYLLPPKARTIWQYVTIGVSSAYAVHNYNLGLRWGW